ncbi:hypothetical protein FOZ63_013430 [Perkinsus olseni]|uniref:Uncharacterized protein n=1 Tax=Perkinsus olseni TaxID=32597 RepID=A0A7J6TRJ7_PEROL|nr:hypothetical protein FOZ63_013430 [Perkinsus olseni]
MDTSPDPSSGSFTLGSVSMGADLLSEAGPLPTSSLRVPPRYAPSLLPGRLDNLYKDLESFYYTPIDDRLKGLVPPPAVPDTSVYHLCRRVYKEKMISVRKGTPAWSPSLLLNVMIPSVTAFRLLWTPGRMLKMREISSTRWSQTYV